MNILAELRRRRSKAETARRLSVDRHQEHQLHLQLVAAASQPGPPPPPADDGGPGLPPHSPAVVTWLPGDHADDPRAADTDDDQHPSDESSPPTSPSRPLSGGSPPPSPPDDDDDVIRAPADVTAAAGLRRPQQQQQPVNERSPGTGRRGLMPVSNGALATGHPGDVNDDDDRQRCCCRVFVVVSRPLLGQSSSCKIGLGYITDYDGNVAGRRILALGHTQCCCCQVSVWSRLETTSGWF